MAQSELAVPAARRGRPPLTDRQRDEQRLEISRHAVRLFRAQGLAATSGGEIARAAAVSERTLWRWFRTKESCVEPLLARSLDAFQDVLRGWPAELGLVEHLAAEYTFGDHAPAGDADAVLAVVGMTRDEPALRAVWLMLFERAERTVGEVLAQRLGLPVDDVEVRGRAAGITAALRLATDDLARAASGGGAQAAPDPVNLRPGALATIIAAVAGVSAS